jgi:hypothetical protein
MIMGQQYWKRALAAEGRRRTMNARRSIFIRCTNRMTMVAVAQEEITAIVNASYIIPMMWMVPSTM